MAAFNLLQHSLCTLERTIGIATFLHVLGHKKIGKQVKESLLQFSHDSVSPTYFSISDLVTHATLKPYIELLFQQYSSSFIPQPNPSGILVSLLGMSFFYSSHLGKFILPDSVPRLHMYIFSKRSLSPRSTWWICL